MLPLSGVRILAVEQYGAGPFGTLQLADLGAEIVKIENAGEGGDVGRHVRHPNDPLPQGDSLFFQARLQSAGGRCAPTRAPCRASCSAPTPTGASTLPST